MTAAEKAELSAKKSAANRGKTHTAETRAKLSVINKAAMNRPEVRAKLSAITKARWAAKSDVEKAVIRAKMSAAAKAYNAKIRAAAENESGGSSSRPRGTQNKKSVR